MSLELIGRKTKLFNKNILSNQYELFSKMSKSKFLVLGGAVPIRQAVTKEIFKRDPIKLHIVDIHENNLVG